MITKLTNAGSLRKMLVAFMLMLVSMGVNAQVTTSALTGTVTEPNGDPLIGASVVAIHQPSGTRYATTTFLV